MRTVRQVCERVPVAKIVVVAALAGAAAGCSSGSTRLGETPLFAGSTPNQQATIGQGVESRDLAPINGQQTALAADPTATDAAAATATAPITTPPGLRQRGWTVEGAPIVEVGSADTAATLSQGFGVPVSVILEANSLSSAADVRAGQRLVIPTYVYRDTPPSTGQTPAAQTATGTPPTTLGAQAAALNGAGHTVKTGETLWSISQLYGVRPDEVVTLNNLPASGNVMVGQTLRIPASAKRAPAKETQVAAIEPSPQPGQVLSDAAAPEIGSVPPAATRQPAAPAADKGVASDGAQGFRWPVRGRIIAGFGKQADGARNDGINLAVPAGTPVRAAEAGTVIYAGNELEGYGNLVLVQHKDDWVSAYAHNEAIKVSRGDKVKRGQHIANVGRTGSVEQPQLHFELRKRSKPVDPLPHLSGA